jgi:hypothetical protein
MPAGADNRQLKNATSGNRACRHLRQSNRPYRNMVSFSQQPVTPPPNPFRHRRQDWYADDGPPESVRTAERTRTHSQDRHPLHAEKAHDNRGEALKSGTNIQARFSPATRAAL